MLCALNFDTSCIHYVLVCSNMCIRRIAIHGLKFQLCALVHSVQHAEYDLYSEHFDGNFHI